MDQILQVFIKNEDMNMIGVIIMYKAYERLSEKDKRSICLLNTYKLDDIDVENKMHTDLDYYSVN